MAVLDVIESEGLRERVVQVGGYLLRELARRGAGCESIGDVRGCGLFAGVEWVWWRATAKRRTPLGAVRVVNKLKDRGFLTSNAGALNNLVKIRPPLVFQREHADAFLAAFDETLCEVDAGP